VISKSQAAAPFSKHVEIIRQESVILNELFHADLFHQGVIIPEEGAERTRVAPAAFPPTRFSF
jgi:hypothetical protein